MVEALIRLTREHWSAAPEVPVPAAHGVIDVVLELREGEVAIACECHSELRRLEEVIRRSNEKALALQELRTHGSLVSRLLVIRSTVQTRAVARTYEATLAAAYPAKTAEAVTALHAKVTDWPGAAIVWAKVESSRAVLLEHPPRGVRVGR